MAREHKSLSKRRAPIYERGARRLNRSRGVSQSAKQDANFCPRLSLVTDRQGLTGLGTLPGGWKTSIRACLRIQLP